MKFVLFVEGKSENLSIKNFLKRWLDKQNLSQRIGLQVVPFKGSADYIKGIDNKAKESLKGPDANQVVAGIGLLDLYGLPQDFTQTIPNWSNLTVKQRYQQSKRKIEKIVGISNFSQFFAVHEFEAWLLSDPTNKGFSTAMQNALSSWPKIGEPENINFDKPPAKVLNELYLKYNRSKYDKTLHGPKLFDTLDVDLAYRKCPYLKGLLDEMLKLAKQAGL